MITERFLLQGAVYALEQCGRLLQAANRENQARDYPTALALASFAREELGRWFILLDLRREVLSGQQYTAQQVNEACADHERKQKAGMASLTMRWDRDSGLEKLFGARRNTKPGSAAFKQAQAQIDKLDEQQRRRVPGERHRQRMAALYVDAVSDTQWRRPVTEVSAKRASEFLSDAVNDYNVQRDRYMNLELLKPAAHELPDALQRGDLELYNALKDDLELHDALKAWTDCPELPLPEHPAYVG